MKILHIITSLLDGGAEGVLYRLCCHDKMNEHIVVSLRDQGKYGKLLSEHGIKIYTLNMKPGKFSIFALYKLIKILKNEKTNIVQTWLYHADFFGGIAARLAGINNLIWNVRHSDFNKDYTKKSLLILVKVLAKFSYFLPKKIIFCSKSSIKLHTRIGYQEYKMEYVPNGYDIQKFRPSPLKKSIFRKKIDMNNQVTLLGCVARFHPQKDHKNLIHALNILKRNKIFFRCILVGFGINKKNKILVNLIKEFDLDNEIILLGSQNNINRIMKKIDIHILASEYGEAFPNVVAEAMASGTPCVVTDVGDSSLIVGKTGWTVKTRNSKSLANSIMKAIKKSKSKEWNYQCQAARNRIVNKFTIKKMINNYNKIWQKTLKN
jgi:glycosyltransferase involved in cell wall biosynthesis